MQIYKMKRTKLLMVTALAGSAVSSFAQKNPREPYNILFIASDDLNSDLHAYGDDQVKTPNIDRLAKMGVAFTHAYNQSPLSGPSRASLLTGYRPDRINVHDLNGRFRNTIPDAVTIPQMFKNNGYYTCRIGKIFHAGVPREIGKPGADDPASWTETFNPIGKDKTDEHKIKILSPVKDVRMLGAALAYMATEGSEDELTDAISANMAVKILRERYSKPGADEEPTLRKIKEQERNQPFFMAVGFYRPHCPYVAPQQYFDLYPEDVELPPFLEDEWDTKPYAALNSLPLFAGLNVEERKEIVRAYYASISFMDAQVGKLLDGLEELNLLDNTIIVFWSDHGYMLGHHGLWQKQNLFEHTCSQPLIVYAPDHSQGVACDRLVEMIDIYPTLAELTGLKAPADLDGKSLVPLLKSPERKWKYPAFTQQARTINPNAKEGDFRYLFNPVVADKNGHPVTGIKTFFGRSVRVERYRYTEWDEGREGVELYDYQTDPNEFNNLAADPAYKELIEELSLILHSSYGKLN